MAKGSLNDKKRRHDELLSCLRSRSYWTAKELSERVATSHRTLMRDLAELKASGIPIESDRGRGGGIRLNGRWGLGRLPLSNTEVISLLLGLAIAESLHSPLLVDNLASIRNRIAASFPDEQRQKVEQLRSRIYVGQNASGTVLNSYQEPDTDLMPTLSQCFIDMKMLSIEYQSDKSEITTRTIEPQMFFLSWPVWYLLAWDHLRQDVRVFRIDRVQKAARLEQSFILRPRHTLMQDMEAYFDQL